MQNYSHGQKNKKLIAAALIEDNGKILIAQRGREEDPLRGMWEFPGGKLEKGETLKECLKRELSEELSIHVEVGEYFCTSTFNKGEVEFDMAVFRVGAFKGEIVLNEHAAIEWVYPKDLLHYPMPDPDLPIVSMLQNSKTQIEKG